MSRKLTNGPWGPSIAIDNGAAIEPNNLKIVVSPDRIARGRALMPENRALIERFSGPRAFRRRS